MRYMTIKVFTVLSCLILSGLIVSYLFWLHLVMSYGVFLKTNIKISLHLGVLLSDSGVGERQGQKTCYYCKGPVMGIPPIAI